MYIYKMLMDPDDLMNLDYCILMDTDGKVLVDCNV